MIRFYNTASVSNKLKRSVEDVLPMSDNEGGDATLITDSGSNEFTEDGSSVSETFGTIMKSFIKLKDWSKEFYEENNSKNSMYMTFFQTNYDEKINETASNAIIYINKIIENPDDKELTTMKYCLDKFLGDMKGKVVFDEDFIKSIYDLSKFISGLLKIFRDCCKDGTMFNHIDEILSTSNEMSKSRYDDLKNLYENKTDSDGENISMKSRLETVKNLAKTLKFKLNPEESADEEVTGVDNISFKEYEDFDDIKTSFTNINNNNAMNLISFVNKSLVEVLDFVASFSELNDCINRLRTVDPLGLKDFQVDLFKSYTNVITEYCLTVSAFSEFANELFSYISAHFSIIKTTFKRNHVLLGL